MIKSSLKRLSLTKIFLPSSQDMSSIIICYEMLVNLG